MRLFVIWVWYNDVIKILIIGLSLAEENTGHIYIDLFDLNEWSIYENIIKCNGIWGLESQQDALAFLIFLL